MKKKIKVGEINWSSSNKSISLRPNDFLTKMPRQFNGGNGGLLAREAQWKQSQRSSAHDTSWMLQLQTVKFQQQCFLTELFSMPKDIWQCLETLPVSQVTGRRTSMASRDKGINTVVHSICQRNFPQQSSICLFLLENPAFEENIVENLSCSMLRVLTCNTKTDAFQQDKTD